MMTNIYKKGLLARNDFNKEYFLIGSYIFSPLWRRNMETHRILLALCVENTPASDELLAQRSSYEQPSW